MLPNISAENHYDEIGNQRRVAVLRQRGVEAWGPERVYIAPEVPLHNIEPGAILKNVAVNGKDTFISRGVVIGTSGPATLCDCQIGEGAQVGAGYYERATLLAGAKVRGFAELRQGTLLEEEAELAHNVGLKHSIFTATVVAGSSINFCDVFITGGKGRSDHSEVGSGTVHFNFDPRGDKFGSLIGDVRGVLLRSRRIFVGGHSGLVAPLHISFGAVIAAGSTVRRDVGADEFYQPTRQPVPATIFDPMVYFDLKRKFINTARLVGNLHALTTWYGAVRVPFASESDKVLYRAALKQIQLHIAHRISELDKVVGKLDVLVSNDSDRNSFHAQHVRIVRARRRITEWLTSGQAKCPPPTSLVREYDQLRSNHTHCEAVRRLSDSTGLETEGWLMEIPARIVGQISELFT